MQMAQEPSCHWPTTACCTNSASTARNELRSAASMRCLRRRRVSPADNAQVHRAQQRRARRGGAPDRAFARVALGCALSVLSTSWVHGSTGGSRSCSDYHIFVEIGNTLSLLKILTLLLLVLNCRRATDRCKDFVTRIGLLWKHKTRFTCAARVPACPS